VKTNRKRVQSEVRVCSKEAVAFREIALRVAIPFWGGRHHHAETTLLHVNQPEPRLNEE
jgi:hypothetical protein